MTKQKIELTVENQKKIFEVEKAYCIGYAGRNKEKTLEHILELEEIGVPRPAEIPELYPVRRNSLNQESEIEVLGQKTSGEAEIVIIYDELGEVFITVGSDHTDRSLETIDINQSKQICDKPLAKKAWKFDSVINHWDELILKSNIKCDGVWRPYQEAPISSIISFNQIEEFLNKKSVPKINSVIFSGTVPLLNGFIYGEAFQMSFFDPVTGDEITTEYAINDLREDV